VDYEKEMPGPSAKAQALKPGIYHHFKGDDFRVHFVARHSEDRNQEFVVYQSLKYPDKTWIRPLKMFTEEVDRDGYRGPRFSYLRPE
jgi:hypothetical protein